MKQRITVDQIAELSTAQQERLREWWTPREFDLAYIEECNEKGSLHTGVCLVDEVQEYEVGEYFVYIEMKNTGEYFGCNRFMLIPLLSIGQMIELLRDQNEFGIDTHKDKFGVAYKKNDGNYISWYKLELCDALWGAVKELLKRDIVPTESA